jgi:hypothetical protein
MVMGLELDLGPVAQSGHYRVDHPTIDADRHMIEARSRKNANRPGA